MYAVVFSSFTGGEGDLFSLRKAAPRAGVILVSADITSAVSGYMIDAAGFLALPVEYNQFASAFKRACRRVRRERDKSILLEGGTWCRRVYAKDVQFVEVNGRFLIYHLFGGSVTTRGQLCGEEKLLEQMGFYRCSAKYMVNLRYVERSTAKTCTSAAARSPFRGGKRKIFLVCWVKVTAAAPSRTKGAHQLRFVREEFRVNKYILEELYEKQGNQSALFKARHRTSCVRNGVYELYGARHAEGERRRA